MSHLYSPNRDSTAVQRGAGPGLTSGWRCAKCCKPQFQQLGRGYRFIAGCKQWVCAGCKAEIDARRKA